jgi:hypothetical protein
VHPAPWEPSDRARQTPRIEIVDGHPFWRSTTQHIELVTKDKDFGLQCRPRPHAACFLDVAAIDMIAVLLSLFRPPRAPTEQEHARTWVCPRCLARVYICPRRRDRGTWLPTVSVYTAPSSKPAVAPLTLKDRLMAVRPTRWTSLRRRMDWRIRLGASWRRHDLDRRPTNGRCPTQ